MKTSRTFVIAALLATVLAVIIGCASLNQSITLQMIYPTDNQTEVTVQYTVPPPPSGKVYVLWIVNPDEHQAQNVGEIRSGQHQTAQTTVGFQATGAIVSIESSANVSTMSNTWALKVGQVAPSTPTPTIIGPTPTPLPFAH
ncbi:MAG TPA: hypothetical protein VFZ25_11575 [Chloroflexota bacterium]|nr:hypothetical protein [Chloroflexota bacterium]